MTGVDLADEDAAFLKFLFDIGWEGEIGEDDGRALVTNGNNYEEYNNEKGDSV